MRRSETILSLALALVMVAGCCCPPIQAAREAAKQAQSKNNIMQFGVALHMHHDATGQWPQELAELQPYLEGELGMLMVNPVTGDDPGYEYVKPEEEAPLSETVWIYQLRDGARDMSLAKGYADGSVR